MIRNVLAVYVYYNKSYTGTKSYELNMSNFTNMKSYIGIN